jgi:ABC-type transporter Mla subunit MlaD
MAADEEVEAAPRMRIGPYATRVAAFTALGIALVVVLLLLAASRDTYEVRAVFDDVRGLIPGGDVTAGAIKVGTVSDVYLNENKDPEVVMEIDGDFVMHQGAFANIRLASNVGAVNRVVDLTEGDPTLPELGDGTVLSGKATDQPVDFDLAVSTLTPKVRDDIGKVLAGLDESLKGRGGDFDRMLQNSSVTLNETANLLVSVNADGEALRTLVSEGQRVVSALAASPDDLGASADRLAQLLQVTGARQTELAQSVQLLGPALSNGRALLERTSESIPHLSRLVHESGPLLDELGPFADEVVPATKAATPFLHQTKKLIAETPPALREQVKFITLAQPVIGRLKPLLDRLNPIADQLRVYSPETVGFFQNVADAASNYDRNGHLIRTLTLAANTPPASTQSGSLGPSDCGPGLLEAPYHRTPGVNECQPWDAWRDSLGNDNSGGGG